MAKEDLKYLYPKFMSMAFDNKQMCIACIDSPFTFAQKLGRQITSKCQNFSVVDPKGDAEGWQPLFYWKISHFQVLN